MILIRRTWLQKRGWTIKSRSWNWMKRWRWRMEMNVIGRKRLLLFVIAWRYFIEFLRLEERLLMLMSQVNVWRLLFVNNNYKSH
jgi:hypothetical protein